MKLDVIYNPAAGGGRAAKKIEPTQNALREMGHDVTFHPTNAPGHAPALVRSIFATGGTNLIAAGGDGTVHEVVSGMMDCGGAGTLGILPLGTGNSFMRDFGIESLDDALSNLKSEARRRVDVVEIQHAAGIKHSLNLVSIGFSADVGSLTNRRFKKLGQYGYVAAVFSTLATLKAPRESFRLDGEIYKGNCVFVSFCNSQYTGGTMHMAPHADASDGKIAVTIAGALGRLELLAAFPSIFKGTHIDHPKIRTTKAKDIDFGQMKIRDVMVDGEVMPLALRRLRSLQHAIEVFA